MRIQYADVSFRYYVTLRIVHSIQNRDARLPNTERRCNTAQAFTNMIVRNALAHRDGPFSAVILFCYLPERRHSTTHLVCRPIIFLLISTSQDLFTTGHALECSTIEEG